MVLVSMHMELFHCHIRGLRKNVVIFIIENSSSVHADNIKKIWFLVKVQDDTTIAEPEYSISFSEQGKKIV